MQPKTLQQRILIFVLVPVFFILAGMGWISFVYARNMIIKQWGETAIAKLQRAAHMIDMRLGRPKDLLLMLKNNYNQEQSYIVQKFVVEQLRKMEGVVEVNVDIVETVNILPRMSGMHRFRKDYMKYGEIEKFQLSLPRYNTKLDGETVSLSTDFKDANDNKVGQIEVVISFQDLFDQIRTATWWKSNKAFLIDNNGNILLADTRRTSDIQFDRFAKTDPLEKRTIEALKKNPYGTVFGPGHPPDEISGYYHLNEAPWSLVLISPGEQVLKTVLHFRFYYLLVGLVSIFSVILFIRIAIAGTANAIKKVTDASKNLANGIFTDQLTVKSRDEVGELTYNFNRMTKQLKERLDLKEAMNLAMQVQQSLLPPTHFSYRNVEISGRSVYCDETGGDYFDIIKFPDNPGKICVAVGDVVGHGISAALLMTTTRALLRSRVMQKGSLPQIMNDVNRLLCLDTAETGSFVTLLLMMVDLEKGHLEWVRAGHEPAMMFNPRDHGISELKGEGLVLGLDEAWDYTGNKFYPVSKGTVILISTDGTWDIENKDGERFGKKRVEKLLEEASLLSSERIVDSIIAETIKFRGGIRQNDDITLLVLKFI